MQSGSNTRIDPWSNIVSHKNISSISYQYSRYKFQLPQLAHFQQFAFHESVKQRRRLLFRLHRSRGGFYDAHSASGEIGEFYGIGRVKVKK